MAPPVFPVTKLLYLVVKQASKPISKTLVERAESSTVFKRFVILPMGRVVYRVRVWAKMKEMGLSGKVTIVPKIVGEEMTELGSQVLAEMIIFAIVGSFLVAAVNLNTSGGGGPERTEGEEELSLIHI